MGVSIGKAQWAYGGFMRFRERLAAHEGLNLHDMDGFTRHGTSWDETTTALRPLLDHSDCDGGLSPGECAQVAPRLAEILAAWQAATYDPIDLGCDYDIQNGWALFEEMVDHAARGGRLDFR
jgi:hypothetical protein